MTLRWLNLNHKFIALPNALKQAHCIKYYYIYIMLEENWKEKWHNLLIYLKFIKEYLIGKHKTSVNFPLTVNLFTLTQTALCKLMIVTHYQNKTLYNRVFLVQICGVVDFSTHQKNPSAVYNEM